MPIAVGTSLLVIAINSATSLVARAGNGIDIDWTIIGVFTAAAVIGSLLGARVATRARPEMLRIAFAVLIIAVGLYTAARSILAIIG
jgi:uncharacterized membrane protein YfcA